MGNSQIEQVILTIMKQSVHPAVLLGVVLGISIVWIDTSPGWNDSLGSVFLIIVAATG